MMITTSNKQNELSVAELQSKASAIFATKPNDGMSDRYVFIPTTQLIEDLANFGWYPVLATQPKAKKNAKKHSDKHIIAFENESDAYTILDENGNVESRIRIVVTNSHDGTTCFKFHIGIFRIICENGLVVSTKSFTEISVKHIGYTLEQVRAVCEKVQNAIPEQIDAMNKMLSVTLTEEQKIALATDAMRIRKGLPNDAPFVLADDDAKVLLTARRDADKVNTLWHTYNIVQENICKGGMTISIDGKKARKMRSIRNAQKDLDINARLFASAYKYAEDAVIVG